MDIPDRCSRFETERMSNREAKRLGIIQIVGGISDRDQSKNGDCAGRKEFKRISTGDLPYLEVG